MAGEDLKDATGFGRLLVVDDDPTLREIATAKLGHAGYAVTCACDGAEGWTALKARAFDLALVDLEMPEVDGYELIARIRGDDRLRHLPVVVVTTHSDEAAIDRALEAGANAFVTKPVHWPLFVQQLRYVARASDDERRLREAKEAAERLVRLKNSFLSVISHELRTPLTHIIGFAEVLQKQGAGPLGNESYLDYANEIADAGRRLYGILTEVILLSRGLSGELELKDGEYRIAAILDQVLEELGPVARLRETVLQADRQHDDCVLCCDIELFKRCLIALLDNAVKFSPGCSIVRLVVTPAPDGTIRFAVADQGPGMSAEQIAECHEPFVQSDMSLRRSAEGIGLGLTLVRTLIGLHDGELMLASGPGPGTTATLILPAHRVMGWRPARKSIAVG